METKLSQQDNLILVGNPNTGKTTFFNAITNSDEHIGNWHGVTVDFKEKHTTIHNQKILVTDLPGMYSMSSYSYEESVARDYLFQNSGKIINICDANNLPRNLYLTLQMLEMGLKPVVCINMANELKKSGISINIDLLSSRLGLKVFFINAQQKEQVKKVVEYAIFGESESLQKVKSLNIQEEYISKLPLADVEKIVGDKINIFSAKHKNFVLIKCLEKDEYILEKLNLSNEQLTQLEQVYSYCNEVTISKLRYDFIDKLIKDCISTKKDAKTYGYSKLDKLILNKYLALPIFLLILSLIFFLTFSSVGKCLSEVLGSFLETYIFCPLLEFVQAKTSNAYIISFVKDAVFGGVGSLVSFLPQITILFVCLTFLEDSGYMSRLAFTLEDYFSKIGLTGKSVFTLLMGFGCSTTSTMTSRNLEDKNSKIKTAMLSPYISCSAKIPLYSVICGAFFVKSQFWIILLLYLTSVIVAVLVSYFLEKTILKSGEQSFIMELPPYRLPKFKRICKVALSNIKSFILRVGTLIISFSIIIWILQSCNFALKFDAENSILKQIGQFLAPVFSPLGFGQWGAVVCLICGVVAKEIIVGTMGMINNVSSEISSNMLISESLLLSSSALSLNPCSALSFLVFSLLYMPCISTIGVMKKEIGTKWTILAVIIQFVIAYLLAYTTYKIALCFTISGVIGGAIACCIFVAIVVSLFVVKKHFKSKNKCLFCPKNKACGKDKC